LATRGRSRIYGNPDTSMKSTAWFDRGADALERVVTGFPRGYVCPLCLRHFPPDQIDELTVDHVPAEQLGGTRMVLTCDTCNHGSGSFVQGEMKRRDNFHDAFTGPLDKPHPVIMTLSTGAVVRAEMVRGADGYQLIILSGNSPEAMKQFR